MNKKSNMKRFQGLVTARIIHFIFVSSALIAIPWGLSLSRAPLAIEDETLVVSEFVFVVMGLLCLLLGFWWMRLTNLRRTTPKNPSDVIRNHIQRLGFFAGVAIFGLTLAWWGAIWPIWLAFLIAATASLILSYPTERRWAKWQQGKS